MTEMDKRLIGREDNEIKRLYDKIYGGSEESAKEIELAEEMIATSAIHEEEDNWSTLTKTGSKKRPAPYQRKKDKRS